MTFVLTKDPGTGVFATLDYTEWEKTPFTLLGAGLTGKVRIVTGDIGDEWSLGTVSVAPGATDYEISVREELSPLAGVHRRYFLARAAADLNNGEILVFENDVTFKHPVELHLKNTGGAPVTFVLTYRLYPRHRYANY